MFPESITLLEKPARDFPDDMMIQGPLGYAYAKSGRKADTEALLKNLTDKSRTKYVSGYFMSWICVGLDRKEGRHSVVGAGLRTRRISTHVEASGPRVRSVAL
jgi:hypothetical protein